MVLLQQSYHCIQSYLQPIRYCAHCKVLGCFEPKKLGLKTHFWLPLCDSCLLQIHFIGQFKFCHFCSVSFIHSNENINHKCLAHPLFAPLIFDPVAQSLILTIKKEGQFEIIIKLLDFALQNNKSISWLENIKKNIDYITWVPTSLKSYQSRLFNVSRIIAKRLSQFLKIPCIQILKRKDKGVFNKGKNRTQRFQGKMQFKRIDSRFSGRILLVDDIVTTGATLSKITPLLENSFTIQIFSLLRTPL